MRFAPFFCTLTLLLFGSWEARAETEYAMPPCINTKGGEQPLVYHVHPQLIITGYRTAKADEPEDDRRPSRLITPFSLVVPANIGVWKGHMPEGLAPPPGKDSCYQEIHTHSYSGMLHVESVTEGTVYKLGHFFEVWALKDHQVKDMLGQIMSVEVLETDGTSYFVPKDEFLEIDITKDLRKIFVRLEVDAYSSD